MRAAADQYPRAQGYIREADMAASGDGSEERNAREYPFLADRSQAAFGSESAEADITRFLA